MSVMMKLEIYEKCVNLHEKHRRHRQPQQQAIELIKATDQMNQIYPLCLITVSPQIERKKKAKTKTKIKTKSKPKKTKDLN